MFYYVCILWRIWPDARGPRINWLSSNRAQITTYSWAVNKNTFLKPQKCFQRPADHFFGVSVPLKDFPIFQIGGLTRLGVSVYWVKSTLNSIFISPCLTLETWFQLFLNLWKVLLCLSFMKNLTRRPGAAYQLTYFQSRSKNYIQLSGQQKILF